MEPTTPKGIASRADAIRAVVSSAKGHASARKCFGRDHS